MREGRLSVIIPAYNEQENIVNTVQTVSAVLDAAYIAYEIIFVDDGSGDATWKNICEISEHSDKIIGIRFSRNFGKEAAIYAGLEESTGDCTAVMDCDLQHPPDKLVEMYRLWQSGAEVIEGLKSSRGEESKVHSVFAKLFYGIISRAAGFDMSDASDFRLLDRKAVTVLMNMKEKSAFFRGLSSWIGFETAQIQFDVQERAAGESKWSMWQLVRYAIKDITSFTTLPMQIVTVMGGLMLVVTILQGIEALVTYFRGQALGGFTTVILLQLFIGSITMLSLGIIGYYIARIYEEVRGRPRYIVSTKTGHGRKLSQDSASADQV